LASAGESSASVVPLDGIASSLSKASLLRSGAVGIRAFA